MINAIGAYIFLIAVLAVVSQRPSMARFEERLQQGASILYLVLLGAGVYLVGYKFGMWSGQFTTSSWPVFVFSSLNLWMHEGGHFFFVWGPPLLHSLGGTLLEIGVPAGLASYAFVRGYFRSLGLWLLWSAFNLFSVATYMADAQLRQLPLLGVTDQDAHDWWNIFSMLGVLQHHQAIASVTAGLACGAAITGLLLYLFGPSSGPISNE